MKKSSISPFYRVIGPKPDAENAEWLRPCVDCWFCLKKDAVTEQNRCFIPVRVQDRIDGSYMTFREIEDSLTRCFGFFCSWSCALGFCLVYYPNICHKVHLFAKRHGHVGILAPTFNPRFVQSRFNPFVSRAESFSNRQLIPSSESGIYMRLVPSHEQQTKKFREFNYVIEETSDDPEFPEEFPQQVVDSEHLMNKLQSMENSKEAVEDICEQITPKKTPKTRKPRQPRQPKRKKDVENVSKDPKITCLQKQQQTLDDFFD